MRSRENVCVKKGSKVQTPALPALTVPSRSSDIGLNCAHVPSAAERRKSAFLLWEHRQRNLPPKTPPTSRQFGFVSPRAPSTVRRAAWCLGQGTPSRCTSNPESFDRGPSICAGTFRARGLARKSTSCCPDIPAWIARAPKVALDKRLHGVRSLDIRRIAPHGPNHPSPQATSTISAASSPLDIPLPYKTESRQTARRPMCVASPPSNDLQGRVLPKGRLP